MNIFENLNLSQKNVHFIGIGGAGMAPLASIIKERGFIVSGSDEKESYITDKLKDKGIEISIGHKGSNIGNADYVVYSAAVHDDNPEIRAAKEKNIITIKRSKFLGDFVNQFSKMVAVSGSHGKTTTSSMITEILINAGKDPTAIVGAENKINDRNHRNGNSEFAVCEACEFMDSFLDLEPYMGIILNIDDDHLDYFKDMETEKKSFKKFAKKCKKILVINSENYNALEITGEINIDKVFYGIKNNENFKDLNFYAQNEISDNNGFYEFDMVSEFSKKMVKTKLKIPGIHNISNALAASSACERLGVDIEISSRVLSDFVGVKRRFEKIGQVGNIKIIDDYAHHPTEIDALFNTISSMKFRESWIIFQPHTFSRTFLLMDDFVKSLSKFDNVIIADIFASREINVYEISAKTLGNKIKNCRFVGSLSEISRFVVPELKDNDLLLTVGAGNVDDCAHEILSNMLQVT
ncbi:MAG: UDP-N-acetylmuramate--L-alanine ligase [Candidatus Improbicoccus pseudotrichonymphae]|uniref:UDP-N-acetylmuramate--L-alanine ligase n=1 Tax=Candidatus Improbicoccus pseudotrichonymphae TaxID=3033792 RepID=A0AA48I4U3_9FIRM|nr:MAG: UDP-N-acetylmuramate--L-alanine ligase [Candidatus Improbicoccus pseudotrichonymphae]